MKLIKLLNNILLSLLLQQQPRPLPHLQSIHDLQNLFIFTNNKNIYFLVRIIFV